jgi:hypothetical protein
MKTLDTNTICGMIIFAVFIAWVIYAIWPRRKKDTPIKQDEEPDEFDPSQIF